MMDATPLYPVPYHPYTLSVRRDYTGPVKHRTRTRHPVKYYYIDFGISRRYNPADGPPLEDPIWGGDKTVPEFHKSLDPCNPFPTDIYYLGNMIRQGFLIVRGSYLLSVRSCLTDKQERYGFDFMGPLIEDMVQDDPSKRPQIDEVASRFQAIRASLNSWKLRSRVVKKGDDPLDFPLRVARHWARRISFILRRVPAVPSV